RQELHEDYCGDLPPRIDPEMRVVDPAPAQTAGASHSPLGRRGFDLESEAELVLARANWKRSRAIGIDRRLLADDEIAELIGGHECQRAFADQLRGAVLPAVQEQLHECGVVARRRQKSAVA